MFEKLGKFEIKRVLGNGAMGEVYLGVDPSIGREVAIKTILPAAAQGGEAKERFAREARAAGVLNHPNLVTIYEFGEDQGVLYIAMELVKGHDLEELLQEQSLTRSEVLEVLAQVCDGIGFAHRQQIVHRDIKPSNVRVQRDGKRLHAKVMDFGVAKISNSDMTATGMVMGTVSYMAPEYIRTGKPDPRSDLFDVFGIQHELDKALRAKVWLKSGGYIVINHTEALVAIDVNTGKFVGKGSTRLEDTIVKTNLEAVKEIVRQIRLRDLGGIIVVDFIDMEERRNREKVLMALQSALEQDKAPSKALSFNEFGLVCITRKRTKQALERVLCQPCPYCTGSGMVKSIPTLCYEIQAEARKMATAEHEGPNLTLRVHPEIAKALKTREAILIDELEQNAHKHIIIQSDATLHWEQYDIY